MNRPQAFLTTLALALAIPAMWTTLGPMRAPSGAIDFETPSLESKGRQTIDPYVDAATGVTFTAEPGRWGDEAVGLVRNNSTSACVEPADANQKLGTGRSNPTAAGPGLSGFAIRARFPGSPSAPMTVSVEFQTTANVP